MSGKCGVEHHHGRETDDEGGRRERLVAATGSTRPDSAAIAPPARASAIASNPVLPQAGDSHNGALRNIR